MLTFVREVIQNAWKNKGLFFYGILMPLSFLFAVLIFLRRYAYTIGLLKSQAVSAPVIVVGNIHSGGSGKTPVVLWLVQQLKQQGYKPGVISRGYGGIQKLPTAVSANSSPALVGDEPTLIAKRCDCPVWIGANRVKVAQALLQTHPECNVLISDDGLQHYALQRAVEIAVIDAEHYLDHAHLLPAGMLREPMRRLQTVDAVISNGQLDLEQQHSTAAANAFSMQLHGTEFYNLVNPHLKASAVEFKLKTIKALAGIGRPERFFEHLRRLGLTFAGSSFEDHHAYTAVDLAKMDCDVLLMTEKDAVKCLSFAKPHYWVLPVVATIDDGLLSVVLAKLQQFQANIQPLLAEKKD